MNDNFVIGFVNSSKPGSLVVFDRLGGIIYLAEEYTNDWDFILENGEPLNDGSYFFTYFEEGREELKGTFEVRRK